MDTISFVDARSLHKIREIPASCTCLQKEAVPSVHVQKFTAPRNDSIRFAPSSPRCFSFSENVTSVPFSFAMARYRFAMETCPPSERKIYLHLRVYPKEPH